MVLEQKFLVEILSLPCISIGPQTGHFLSFSWVLFVKYERVGLEICEVSFNLNQWFYNHSVEYTILFLKYWHRTSCVFISSAYKFIWFKRFPVVSLLVPHLLVVALIKSSKGLLGLHTEAIDNSEVSKESSIRILEKPLCNWRQKLPLVAL